MQLLRPLIIKKINRTLKKRNPNVAAITGRFRRADFGIQFDLLIKLKNREKATAYPWVTNELILDETESIIVGIISDVLSDEIEDHLRGET